MIVKVKHHCSDFNSYRAARVKSLFNAENGCDWERSAELPVEGLDWKIGLIVGLSGSGKTSIGSRIFGEPIYDLYAGWDATKPIVDCIAPDGDFNAVTGALSAVGLGDVPAWLRPFPVLSNGEPVCHVAVSPLFTAGAYRATRLVVMPEWQGIGVGTKFLAAVCEYHRQGHGRCGKMLPVFFHTSHPQLCGALRHSRKWVQTAASLYGANKTKSISSLIKSAARKGQPGRPTSGYGGHFRAVQAFKYINNGC